ncbi:MAG: DUF805 domain-containing protein [Methanosarcinaceae archaeon]|nr:DUF805 domain-containing protein [Methanosarcinaceae archaeon]
MKTALTKWSGRFSRKEYIIFLLGAWGISIVIAILMGVITGLLASSSIEIVVTLLSVIFMVWYLVVTIASLGAVVRRLHDTDRSGWYILIGLIPLVNLVLLYWIFIVPSKEVGETRWG